MSKKRILIVDDESSLTRVVRLNLEGTGRFEVRVENHAVNALSAAKEFEPHLIVLDVMMPSMDGGDVKAQIRRNAKLKTTPIIFLTASVSPSEAGNGGFTSGGELFLGKPVSTEKLVEVIDQQIAAQSPDLPPVVSPPETRASA
ncbi:MAG: response regulator [Verrucomicrobia bacterium]|nr:response regulator [Verrucomicrobiota bacterium]